MWAQPKRDRLCLVNAIGEAMKMVSDRVINTTGAAIPFEESGEGEPVPFSLGYWGGSGVSRLSRLHFCA